MLQVLLTPRSTKTCYSRYWEIPRETLGGIEWDSDTGLTSKNIWKSIAEKFIAEITAATAGNMSVIDAIFAIWNHTGILSTCGVPSCNHDTNSSVKGGVKYVTPFWNSCRCTFCHVSTPSDKKTGLVILQNMRPQDMVILVFYLCI